MSNNFAQQTWDLARLNSLVRDGVEESLNLEYKRSDALNKTDRAKKELSKDVSAFANSAGGTIVYGIVESGHKPDSIDGGCDLSEISREWLENTIHGNIRPRIDGIRICPVPLAEMHAGRCAYVVEVPQSATAHQASDKRYYRRYNFHSVPMEDYELRDVMNRVKHPHLTTKFDYSTSIITQHEHRYNLLITILNEGSLCAKHVKLAFCFPTEMLSTKQLDRAVVRTLPKLPAELGYAVSEYHVTNNNIIFPGEPWGVLDGNRYFLTYKVNNSLFSNLMPKSPQLFWKLFADDAPPKEGAKPISELIKF